MKYVVKKGQVFGIFTVIEEIINDFDRKHRFLKVNCVEGKTHIKYLFSVINTKSIYCRNCKLDKPKPRRKREDSVECPALRAVNYVNKHRDREDEESW